MSALRVISFDEIQTPQHRALRPRVFSRLLSIREWVRLCRTIDEGYGEKVAASVQTGSGWGDNRFCVGEHSGMVRFNVVEVNRTNSKLYVVVDVEGGVGIVKVNF